MTYLAFLPGELVGTRAGWPAGSEPTVEKLGAKVRVTTNDAAREKLYQLIQLRLNAYGPFFRSCSQHRSSCPRTI